MFVPEYTITPNILKNITGIEYNRAIIENSNILHNFENRLTKEATTNYIVASLRYIGELPNQEAIKKFVDGITKLHSPKIVNLLNGLEQSESLGKNFDIEEKDIKYLHAIVTKGVIPVTKQGLYRSNRIEQKVEPETILAEINELTDWYNGLDSKDTNPILVAGILKGQLETIYPFEGYNYLVSNLLMRIIFKNRGYSLIKYIHPETFFEYSKRDYKLYINTIVEEEGDFTAWLEYFTEGLAAQVATATEKIKLYAKDTKLAKVSGRIGLTQRQEKIIEYIQDYGMLSNKNFPLLFPNISEDSVLRDLKKLTDLEMIVKRGKTKSSRYELK